MFPTNLRYLRKKFGLTQDDVAKLLGYKSFTTVQKWEEGKSEPNMLKIYMLADIFQVSIEDLVLRDIPNKSKVVDMPEKKQRYFIPLLGKIAAGVPVEAVEEILDQVEITEEMAMQGDHFALKINGDSMEPRFFLGDIVIVKQQSDVESGEIAAVFINGCDATCKKVLKQPNGIMLTSLNPNYEPVFYSKKDVMELPVVILGKVVELRAKL